MTADEACATLRIKPATLYAYVSRGQLTATPAPGDPRQSLYDGDAIAQLASRKRTGRKRAQIAQSTIAWGEPVLESAITNVRQGRLFYRGQDATDLCARATLEDVARLLLDSDQHAALRASGTASSGGVKAGFAFLVEALPTALPVSGRAQDSLNQEALALFADFSRALSGVGGALPAHAQLADRWGLIAREDEDGIAMIRMALVLLADHELNPSTFAARVAASTGASLPACALAGFATLTGPTHGQAALQSLALMRAAQKTSPEKAIQAALAAGQALPFMGHPLYPSGDPRAKVLIDRLPPRSISRRMISHLHQLTGQDPNIDHALAALVVELNLPDEAPLMIFAMARMAGWMAHAIEQATSGQPIRPRSTYRGL